MGAGGGYTPYRSSDEGNSLRKRKFSAATLISAVVILAFLGFCGFGCYSFIKGLMVYQDSVSTLERQVSIQSVLSSSELSLQDDFNWSVTIKDNSQQDIRQLAIVIDDNPFQNFVRMA